ncbi:nicotinate-nucleotide--dimethylbenzimidazole phosphoribosyltransferase [Corynebacterium sp. AOP40-9SA-29]|uniref:nicotinate-nucleotide--dimethylbenzimidazole phosphoribosyltransferase n=1 Tax=Corynebacterium sp. AOP40-9SA-29 TaxID=3457677 RepID=UPI0040341794
MTVQPVLQHLAGWAESTGCLEALRAQDVRPELLLTAADHAVARPASESVSPVSTLPWGHAAGEAARIESGDSPLSALADQAGVDVTVTQFDSTDSAESAESTMGEASPHSRWLDAGAEAADARADSGRPLLLTGTVGAGATTTAAALIGTLCNVEPVKVVGRGGGPTPIADERWKHKTIAVRDLMFRTRSRRRRPVDETAVREILDEIGSPDIAFLTGVLSQSTVRRTPVVLDGVTGLAAGLLADAVTPGAAKWWLMPDASSEPAAVPALRRLDLTPVVDRPLGAPAAASGLLVLPLLTAACAVN